MFAWLRRVRIRGIKVLGIELEFDHSPDTGSISPATPKQAALQAEKSSTAPRSIAFTIHGRVIQTVGRDLGIRVRNEAELRAFWHINQIDTKLDWFGPGAPVISIGRKIDTAAP